MIWKYVTPRLLDRIRGKSQKEAQAIIAEFNPIAKQKDLTRPVEVEVPVEQSLAAPFSSASQISAGERQAEPECNEIYRRSGGKNPYSVKTSTPPQEPEVETVKMHEVRCLIDDEVLQQLEKCKSLMSGKYPRGIDYNILLKELASEWLDKNDPVVRAERKEKRNQSTSRKKQSQKKNENPTRYIAQAKRDAIFNRDKGRCTFVGENGKRCNSTWDLEIHHDGTPFGRGGGHSMSNLRLLCATHNKLEAERVYGEQHMEKHCRRE
jgi:5-methylcytosine-specific restriction endonuclease McrA